MNRYKRRRYSRPPKDAEIVTLRGVTYYMGYVPLLTKAEDGSPLFRLRGFWLHPTKGWRHAIGERVG